MGDTLPHFFMKFLKFLLCLFITDEIYTGTGDDAHEDTGDANGNVNPF
jgi:hypothetical protein